MATADTTYQKYVALADRLIAEHGFDTDSFSRFRGKLEITYGASREVSEAVSKLTGNEMLELAHTADSGNTVSTQEALAAMHIDLSLRFASMIIPAAASAALAIIIAGRVQDPPLMTDPK